jgi:carboxyl-terminal processing protease
LILDLRGNAGGDFFAAIDAAMLFVPKGATIVSVRSRSGFRSYANTMASAKAPLGRVFVWQNEGTASAAEVFLAALTENGGAVSVGRRSFGKGTRQDIIELHDGSALIMTTGILLTPQGVEYDGRGLPPKLEARGGTSEYVRVTQRATLPRAGVGAVHLDSLAAPTKMDESR